MVIQILIKERYRERRDLEPLSRLRLAEIEESLGLNRMHATKLRDALAKEFGGMGKS
jgi:hypothetical protein